MTAITEWTNAMIEEREEGRKVSDVLDDAQAIERIAGKIAALVAQISREAADLGCLVAASPFAPVGKPTHSDAWLTEVLADEVAEHFLFDANAMALLRVMVREASKEAVVRAMLQASVEGI